MNVRVSSFSGIASAAIFISALYFARELLVPIVLAVLLAFVLTPLVERFERWKLPKAPAVFLAVCLAFAIIFSLGTMVVTQVNQLAGDLPKYRTTLRDKVQTVRDAIGGPGIFQNATILLKDLSKELEEKPPEQPNTLPGINSEPTPSKPLAVEVHQPDPGASETLVAVLKPLMSPLTTSGIVVIFTIFFLIQRDDLRNRVIKLAGVRDLERTTAALNDGGRRLTRLFATQLALNAAFGFVIGSGLALIGVPSAPLWGLIAMILRFVPYIGAILSALLPLSLAAAVGPDWSMAVWTLALFLIVEPITGHVIEPLLYGHSSGLSPVAIVVSASFWTWLWGPLGLLLSTPLTVCLLVIARHDDRLKFIDVMLGDQPPLTLQEMTYQRMLARDPIETSEQALVFLKDNSVLEYYETVLLGGIRLAQSDAERGRLNDEQLSNILATVKDVVTDLSDYSAKELVTTKSKNNASQLLGTNVIELGPRETKDKVICIPGFGILDEAVAIIVADALTRHGFETKIAKEIDDASPLIVCFVELISEARMEYTRRRMSGGNPSRVLFAFLGPRVENASPRTDGIAPETLPEFISKIRNYLA